MELTRSQVEEFRLKGAFILKGFTGESQSRHWISLHVEIPLSLPKMLNIVLHQIISPHRMSALGRKLNFDASCGMRLV